NLGAAYLKLAKMETARREVYQNAAEKAFRAALETAAAVPRQGRNQQLQLSHFNLGLILAERGLLDEAIAEEEEALRIDPNWDAAHRNLGIMLAKQGRYDEAAPH